MTLDDALELLDHLRFHWGEAYLISFFEPDQWIAQRRDNLETLTAKTPYGLREAIVADYTEHPVPRPEVSPVSGRSNSH